jgi:hypothetical protein
MAEIVRAIECFAFTGHDGVPRVITPGVLMATDDPDYKGKEELFESVEVAAARPAQQAAGESESQAHNLPKVDDVAAQPTTKRSVRRRR